MISDKMAAAINTQVNREMYSAYLYLAMSAYSESIDLPGFANWFRIQYQEEMVHAFGLYDYLISRDYTPVLLAIEQPPKAFGTPLEIFKAALEHEKKVTAWINELVTMAVAEQDYAAQSFLQWYVKEQVEEEATAKLIIQELKMAGNDGSTLFMINRELGARVFTAPVVGQ
ncbi:MAG: ferritin [Sedimentisphaerales bacterium]|nr:ferritin [Sedimentisphaerales bacterium]MBN2842350.1 ferritin [Sedimentisphaerales bacterium]